MKNSPGHWASRRVCGNEAISDVGINLLLPATVVDEAEPNLWLEQGPPLAHLAPWLPPRPDPHNRHSYRLYRLPIASGVNSHDLRAEESRPE